MSQTEFVALRERCFSIIKDELKKHYDNVMFDLLFNLMFAHQLIPEVPLVIQTYKGIIGYHNWLLKHKSSTESFLPDVLHDLAECRTFDRDDGYIPRTSGYAQFYTLKQ